MKKTILFLLFFFISYTSNANESFEFTKDCIKIFKVLNESTLIFVQKVQNAKNKESVENLTMKYVTTLVDAQNILLKHTKSPDSSISEVAYDLRSLLSDLVKENYSFLNTIKKSSSIKNIYTDFIVKIGFITAYFGNISLGICSTTVDSQIENSSNDLSVFVTSKLIKPSADDEDCTMWIWDRDSEQDSKYYRRFVPSTNPVGGEIWESYMEVKWSKI